MSALKAERILLALKAMVDRNVNSYRIVNSTGASTPFVVRNLVALKSCVVNSHS